MPGLRESGTVQLALGQSWPMTHIPTTGPAPALRDGIPLGGAEFKAPALHLAMELSQVNWTFGKQQVDHAGSRSDLDGTTRTEVVRI